MNDDSGGHSGEPLTTGVDSAQMRAMGLADGRASVDRDPPARPPTVSILRLGERLPVSWGRYQLRELLGRGGMGKVFGAWDPTLQRMVALKILLGTESDQVARFLREAQAQARVDHPAVCKVYEAGDVDGVPFISMQLIRGGTIRQATASLPLERQIELLREVAEGVHAAHRTGLIHRDLKPANILVEASEDGRLRPFVVDFGLARSVGDARATLSGLAIGTPSYMAPEQIRGDIDRMDRRTDVYGLGVTIYEVLTRRTPFDGAGPVEIMMAAIEREPAPPRTLNPALPVDLETVVLRCLEKDPVRRYESARAVAEDLGRVLDGEPVQGRRSGVFRRWVRKARKHRMAVRVAAVSAVIVLALLAVLVRTRMAAGQRSRLAEQFARETTASEALIRYAYMLPPHDVSAEEVALRSRLVGLEAQIAALGDVAEGPGQYALGRGYLALRDWERGLLHLQKAWAADYREAAVAYAIGLTQGRMFDRKVEEASRLPSRSERERCLADLEGSFREPALSYLRAGQRTPNEVAEYVDALLAFYDKDPQRAVERSEAAVARVPWLWEAPLLVSRVHADRAAAARFAGRWDEALARLREAETALHRAEAIARSAPEVQEALCGVAVERLTTLREASRGIEAAYAQVREVCRRALAVVPRSPFIHVRLATATWQMAGVRSERGQDPLPLLEEQIALARRAVELDPKQIEPLNVLGLGYIALGDERRRRSEDPRPSYDQAIGALASALAVDPNLVSACNNIGLAHDRVAFWERDHDRDPMPRFRQAVDSYRRAVGILPEWVLPRSNLGAVLVDMGRYMMDRGEDPRPLIRQAVEQLRQCVRLNPNDRRPHNNIGWALRVSADYVSNRGGDPEPDLAAAEASLIQATRIDPGYALAWDNHGEVLRRRAEYHLASGRDPRPVAEQAVAIFRKAAAVNPRYADALYGQGEIWRVVTEHALLIGTDAEKPAARGLQALGTALHLQPDLGGAFEERAWILLLLARSRSQRGVPPGQALGGVQAALARALALSPRSADACRLRGELALERAHGFAGSRRIPGSLLDEAGKWLHRAVQINRFDVAAQVDLAALARLRAEADRAGGGGPAAALREGLACAQAALAISAGDPRALAQSGALRLAQARNASGSERIRLALEALRAFDRALERNRFLARGLGTDRELARRLAGGGSGR